MKVLADRICKDISNVRKKERIPLSGVFEKNGVAVLAEAAMRVRSKRSEARPRGPSAGAEAQRSDEHERVEPGRRTWGF